MTYDQFLNVSDWDDFVYLIGKKKNWIDWARILIISYVLLLVWSLLWTALHSSPIFLVVTLIVVVVYFIRRKIMIREHLKVAQSVVEKFVKE